MKDFVGNEILEGDFIAFSVSPYEMRVGLYTGKKTKYGEVKLITIRKKDKKWVVKESVVLGYESRFLKISEESIPNYHRKLLCMEKIKIVAPNLNL